MSIELGSAYISILPATSKLVPEIKRELGLAERLASQSGDRAGRTFGQKFGAAAGRYAKRGLFAAGAGVTFLGAAGLKTAAQLEQSQIGFETMLGSAEKANDFLAQIKKTAAQTPFQLKGLTQASQKMLAYGFNVKDVIPTLTTLGDAAAGLGLGIEGLDRITLALGQMKAKGRVQGNEILQLTEAGIPAMKILQNELGLTAEEYDKMQRTGKIAAKTAIPALLKGMEKGTDGLAGKTAKFGGLMEKQSKSLSGLFSTLKDTVLVGLADAITPLIPTLKQGLTKAIEDLGPALASGGKHLSKFIKGMKEGTGSGGEFADTMKTIWSVVKPVLKTVESLTKAFVGLPSGAQKIALLAGAAFLLQNRFSGALTSLQSFDRKQAIATTKSVAFKGAAVGLGIALGGLADKAGGANTTLGGLATIGAGVATGAAFGPWGAVIGGATGLLSTFSAASKSAAQEQEGLRTAGQRVAETLDIQSGALTKLTRATAAKELADSGALAAAKAMGISLNDVLDASLGTGGAIFKVVAASEHWADTQARAGKYTEKQEGQLQTLRKAIGATKSAIDKKRKSIDLVNEAMGKGKSRDLKYDVKVKATGLTGVLETFASLGDSLSNALKGKEPGENAKGTNNWRGGLTWVGEKGPELLNIQKGAQIIPNHRVNSVGREIAATSASTMALAPSPAAAFPKKVTLSVGGREFDAYVNELAEDTYNGENAFAGTARRMN